MHAGIASGHRCKHSDSALIGHSETEMTTPSTFGQFLISGPPVGVGQSASVYRAIDQETGEPRALKVFNADTFQDKVSAQRFEREVAILLGLNHPSIIRSFGHGIHESKPWISMEFCEGRSLKDYEHSPDFSIGKKLRGLARVASALDHTHASGVIHRDIKPSNVLIHASGDFVLSDFGVAKMLNDSSKLTATGNVLGTVAYMSPEQAQDQQLTAASDIYSLGVIAYQCLFNALPFTGSSSPAVMLKHITEAVPIPPNTNPLIASVLRRAMAKDPAQRWKSATDFIAMLNEALLDAFQSSSSDGNVTQIATAIPQQMRLLIADEDAENRRWLSKYFDRSNVSMSVTRTSPETLQKILYGGFDVLVIQLDMSIVDGVEIIRRVREVERRYGKRGLILATASEPSTTDRARANSAGADLVVTRPPLSNELDPIIKMFSGNNARV